LIYSIRTTIPFPVTNLHISRNDTSSSQVRAYLSMYLSAPPPSNLYTWNSSIKTIILPINRLEWDTRCLPVPNTNKESRNINLQILHIFIPSIYH